MEPLGWNIYLFLSKWILIILVYVALLVVLLSVRREMGLHLATKDEPLSSPAPGKLKVLQIGSDTKLQAGKTIDLALSTCIGAETDNEIILDDAYISGHHARLHWDGSAWWVEDLGSRNGTFMNQVRLSPNASHRFSSGAHLKLGDVEFELMD